MATANNHKSTASKTTSAKPTKAAPKTAAKRDLDDELDGAAGTKGGGDVPYWKKMNALPAAKRIQIRVANVSDRLARLVDDTTGWQGMDAFQPSLLTAELKDLATKVAQIGLAFGGAPDGYKPTAARAGKAPKGEIVVGSLIRLTDKQAPNYAGALEPAQMVGIKVLEVRDNKLVALTNDGVKMLISRGHVCLDAATAAPAV